MQQLIFAWALLLTASCAVAVGQAPRVDLTGTYRGKDALAWTELLGHENENVRRQAAYALGRIGPSAHTAVPALIKTLKDPRLESRWYALDALGRIGPAAKTAVPAILEALQDPANDDVVRRTAVTSLGRLGPAAQAAVPDLARALRSEDPQLRVAAAHALWSVTNKDEALKYLYHFLASNHHDAAYQAATALREIHPDAELPLEPVVAALGHPSPDVRRATAKVLQKIGPSALVPLVAALRTEADVDQQMTIVALGLVIENLRASRLYNPSVPRDEFVALAKTLVQDVAPELVKRLSDPRQAVRGSAARTLARMGILAVPTLLRVLEADDDLARQSAAESLVALEGDLPPPETAGAEIESVRRKLVGPLIQSLEHADVQVRDCAVRLFAALAIGPYGSPAAPSLRRALKRDDARIRRYASQALQRLGGQP